jgi:hypothetical protein
MPKDMSKRAERAIESEIARLQNKVNKLRHQAADLETLAEQLSQQKDRLKALLEPKAEG